MVEFAYTHHGNGLLEYFWHKNMAAGNPAGLAEASSWFGVAVFSYGVAPFVFNFRDSMEDPRGVGRAVRVGLLQVEGSLLALVALGPFHVRLAQTLGRFLSKEPISLLSHHKHNRKGLLLLLLVWLRLWLWLWLGLGLWLSSGRQG